MSDNYITNVLNILRLLKRTDMYSGNSALHNIQKWCPEAASTAAQMRFAAYIVDQCEGALDVINTSRLTNEAKSGLVQTVNSLRSAFQIEGLQSALQSFIPQMDTALSSFAILASVYAEEIPLSENDDLKALIEDVENLISRIGESDIDGPITEIARRHLHVLSTLLRNIDAVGIDAALAAYAELVIRLRRADANSPPETREKTASVWEGILSWSERLSKLSELVGSGTKLLETGSNVAQALIGYLAAK